MRDVSGSVRVPVTAHNPIIQNLPPVVKAFMLTICGIGDIIHVFILRLVKIHSFYLLKRFIMRNEVAVEVFAWYVLRQVNLI